ncbi:MAG: TIM barrel protein [Phycisphaerae bacterium]
MGCETKQTQEQITGLPRPVLLRIEGPATSAELREQYGGAVTAGFDGIELALHATGNGGSRVAADDEPDLATGTVEDNLEIGVVAARCFATDIAAAAAEVTTLIKNAASLHAQCLNLTIPPIARAAGDEGFTSYQDSLNFAYKLLDRTRFEAEATGVAVALEAGADGGLLSPVELREIIDAANSWAVGACIDVTRIARFGSPVDWIKTLRCGVHTVRVHDVHTSDRPASTAACGTATACGTDFPVGQAVNLAAIIEALDDIGYDRPIIVAGPGRPGEIRAQLTKFGLPIVCPSESVR